MNALRPSQAQWLAHLSDTELVSVVPFDSTCGAKFLVAKARIQALLGLNQPVEHMGASRLGISGQDEIDVYVPVSPETFETTVTLMRTGFGEPRSHYPLKRARFVTFVEQKHIDIFVINQEDEGWLENAAFHTVLLSDPEKLDQYRRLKEGASGQSIREYYRRKMEFINEVTRFKKR